MTPTPEQLARWRACIAVLPQCWWGFVDAARWPDAKLRLDLAGAGWLAIMRPLVGGEDTAPSVEVWASAEVPGGKEGRFGTGPVLALMLDPAVKAAALYGASVVTCENWA